MKFLFKVKDQNKLAFEVKNGETKAFECSDEVIAYAKANLKKGDGIACGEGNTAFTKGVITKLVKWEPRKKQESTSSGESSSDGYKKGGYQKKSYSGGGGYNDPNRQKSIIRQVIFKAAVDMLCAGVIKGTIQEAYKNLKSIMSAELMCTGEVASVAATPVQAPEKKSAALVEEEPEAEVAEEVEEEPEDALEEEEYN